MHEVEQQTMLNKLMTVTIYCNKRLENDVAFGINVENGEDVFIHPSVVRAHNVDVGMSADMIVMPNKPDKAHMTPWQAVRMVDNTLRQDEVVTEATWEERVTSLFLDEEDHFPRTTAEVAAALGTETVAIAKVLERMHHNGKLAKSKVYASGMQDSASFCMWAPKTDWFTL